MSLERAKRANKVVDVRERATKLCESDLARAVMATRAAVAAEDAARAAWRRESFADVTGAVLASELIDRDTRLRQMLRHADTLATHVAKARAEEAKARTTLSVARLELKKVEGWRDGLLLEAANDEASRERKSVDELAARMARTG